MGTRNEIKAPKSEKSNLKHFSFLGTPVKIGAKRNEDEDKKNIHSKIYLPPKPVTSTSANGSFRKEKFRSNYREFSSQKNPKQLNLDLSNFEESSILEDSGNYVGYYYTNKENLKYLAKEDYEVPPRSPQYNKFLDIERENEIQRLKEEVKRLQVNNFFLLTLFLEKR